MSALTFIPTSIFSPLLRNPIKRANHSSAFRRTPKCCQSIEKLRVAAAEQLSPANISVTSLDWNERVLTICIDRHDGITADDCAEASNVVEQLLEDGEYLGDAIYTLEVSTPGAKDVLTTEKEYAAFKGFPVTVSTREEIKGKTKFSGNLVTVKDGVVRISVKGRTLKFNKDDVEEVRLCTTLELDSG